jgi:hypothetical protein
MVWKLSKLQSGFNELGFFLELFEFRTVTPDEVRTIILNVYQTKLQVPIR